MNAKNELANASKLSTTICVIPKAQLYLFTELFHKDFSTYNKNNCNY